MPIEQQEPDTLPMSALSGGQKGEPDTLPLSALSGRNATRPLGRSISGRLGFDASGAANAAAGNIPFLPGGPGSPNVTPDPRPNPNIGYGQQDQAPSQYVPPPRHRVYNAGIDAIRAVGAATGGSKTAVNPNLGYGVQNEGQNAHPFQGASAVGSRAMASSDQLSNDIQGAFNASYNLAAAIQNGDQRKIAQYTQALKGFSPAARHGALRLGVPDVAATGDMSRPMEEALASVPKMSNAKFKQELDRRELAQGDTQAAENTLTKSYSDVSQWITDRISDHIKRNPLVGGNPFDPEHSMANMGLNKVATEGIAGLANPLNAVNMTAKMATDPVATAGEAVNSINNIWGKDMDGKPVTPEMRMQGVMLLGTLALGADAPLEIAKGAWKAGEKVPAALDLSKQTGMTPVQAYKALNVLDAATKGSMDIRSDPYGSSIGRKAAPRPLMPNEKAAITEAAINPPASDLAALTSVRRMSRFSPKPLDTGGAVQELPVGKYIENNKPPTPLDYTPTYGPDDFHGLQREQFVKAGWKDYTQAQLDQINHLIDTVKGAGRKLRPEKQALMDSLEYGVPNPQIRSELEGKFDAANPQPKPETATKPGKTKPAAKKVAVASPGSDTGAVGAPPTSETPPVIQAPETAPTGTTFTTEKGSTYQTHPDGSTTRNKAPRPEHPGDAGPQPQSEFTVYVNPEDANKLSLMQAVGTGKKLVRLDDGSIGVQYTDGINAGKIEKSTLVKPELSPKEGLLPVESFNGGKDVHFGNKIVSVETPKLGPKALSDEQFSQAVANQTPTEKTPLIEGKAGGASGVPPEPMPHLESAPAPSYKSTTEAMDALDRGELQEGDRFTLADGMKMKVARNNVGKVGISTDIPANVTGHPETTPVYYHGSRTPGFKEFDTTGNGLLGPGAYFTTDPEVAAGYTGKHGGTYKVHLNTENPASVKDWDAARLEAAGELGYNPNGQYPLGRTAEDQIEINDLANKKLRDRGYDSIAVGDQIAVFDNKHISSAIGNKEVPPNPFEGPEYNAPVQTEQIQKTAEGNVPSGRGRENIEAGSVGEGKGNQEPAGGIQEPANKGETAKGPSEEATGLARRFEDAERWARGESKTPPEGMTIEELDQRGKHLIESGQVDPEKVISENRPMTPDETAAVTHYKRELMNKLNGFYDDLKDSKTMMQADYISKRINEITDRLDQISEAAQRTRGYWHQGGQALQLAYEPDFSIADLKRRASAFNEGEPLSDKQNAALEDHATKIKDLSADLDKTKKNVVRDLLSAPARAIKYTKDKLIQIVRQGKAQEGINPANFKKSGNVDPRPGKRGTGGAVGLGFGKLKTEAGVQAAIRNLAVQYQQAGAKSIDAILQQFGKDLPFLSHDEILDSISGKYSAQRRALTAEQIAAQDTLKSIKRQAEFRRLPGWKRFAAIAGDAVNTFRTAKLLGHATAPGIQGRPFFFMGNALKQGGWKGAIPSLGSKEWSEAFGAMLKGYAGGKETFDVGPGINKTVGYKGGAPAENNWLAAQQNDEALWRDVKKAGFDKTLARPHGSPSQIEEENIGRNLVEKIPLLGAASERSSAGFNNYMNDVKMGAFKSAREAAARMGLKGEARDTFLKDMGNMIATTGGRSTSQLATMLASKTSSVLFAPRYMVSKWEYATLKPLRDATSPQAQAMIAKMYATHAVGTVAVGTALAVGLNKAGINAYFDVNPHSSFFGHVVVKVSGKIKAALDVAGPSAEPMKLIFKGLGNSISESGKETPASMSNLGTVVGNYFLNKLTPGPRAAAAAKLGTYTETQDGLKRSNPLFGPQDPNKPKFPLKQEAANLAAPIMIQAAAESNAGGVPFGASIGPSSIGYNVKAVPPTSNKPAVRRNLFGGVVKY